MTTKCLGALPPLKTILSKTIFWHSISQDERNFEFVHWATTSFLRFNVFKGCRPSFIIVSSNFGTNPIIYIVGAATYVGERKRFRITSIYLSLIKNKFVFNKLRIIFFRYHHSI